MSKWNYIGDVNVENGGYWWRQERPDDDFVEAVEVVPESDMGGPDNVFMIFMGSIYLGNEDTLKRAAACCGLEGKTLTLAEKVDAVKSYAGMDVDGQHDIQIGPADPHGKETELKPCQIRGNWKVKNFIKRNYL